MKNVDRGTIPFSEYKQKFKALADEKRLEIMHELSRHDSVCVCDLTDILGLSQSKLSYHLKILLDADFITREIRGTWSYYILQEDAVNHILSEDLCCLFRKESRQPSAKNQNR